ncbi:MAG: hypothetical protein DMF51_15985 [Acidobacteria bacterium]|nr:MAG: hypothetical protein DMF51_15985 [Acidobacteriota bacterium]
MVKSAGLGEAPAPGTSTEGGQAMRNRSGLRGALFMTVLALAVTGLVAGEHEKCTKSAGECAAHMKAMYQTRGWMGVEMDPNDDGSLRLVTVVPGSPADKAGLKTADALVSVNGVTLTKETVEKTMMSDDAWKIGSTVSFGVKRGETLSTVKVTLEKIPEAVLAGMIERHTKEAHEIAKN